LSLFTAGKKVSLVWYTLGLKKSEKLRDCGLFVVIFVCNTDHLFFAFACMFNSDFNPVGIVFPSRANNKELRECRDQIQMYQEMTAVKDQVVVSLTNQVNNDRNLVKGRLVID